MDDEKRLQKIQALTAIRDKATAMAGKGADAFTVRDFISEGKKQLAYSLPDKENYRKATGAAERYKAK